MTAPNIAELSIITGKTFVGDLSNSLATLVAGASNKVMKINSIVVANVDGVNSASVNISLQRSSTDYYVVKTVEVPGDTTLVVLDKDMGIYLEEADILRGSASVDGDLQVVVSYEEIS